MVVEIFRLLAFAYLILSDLALPVAPKTIDLGISKQSMFLADATIYSLAPKGKATPFQILAHQLNDACLGQSKLRLYGLEWGTVFPGHFNYSVYLDYG